MKTIHSYRIRYALLCVLTILLGLCSRKYGMHLPAFLAEYAGDALWAAMVYFGVSFLFPFRRVRVRALAALLFSYAIEVSQLYQADWINEIRSTMLGALVLGHGFLWSDLVCYTVGVFLAMLVGVVMCRNATKNTMNSVCI